MTARRTALITGASMGLGSDYARLCARDGMDVILVARSRDKLQQLADELSAAHGITAHVLPVDLDARDAADVVRRGVQALGVEVDVLVNNAGFGTTGAFVDADLGKELSMVHVNIESLVALTHVFLGPMVARGRGRVLLVASTAGFQPAPSMAVYCATKAFVISFGDAVAYELRGTGVTLTTHCPGATETEFARTAGNADTMIFKTRAIVATSADCAADGYAAMNRGRALAVHGVSNWLTTVLAPLLPRAVLLFIAAKILGWKGAGARPA